jgi:hypothetical protein
MRAGVGLLRRAIRRLQPRRLRHSQLQLNPMPFHPVLFHRARHRQTMHAPSRPRRWHNPAKALPARDRPQVRPNHHCRRLPLCSAFLILLRPEEMAPKNWPLLRVFSTANPASRKTPAKPRNGCGSPSASRTPRQRCCFPISMFAATGFQKAATRRACCSMSPPARLCPALQNGFATCKQGAAGKAALRIFDFLTNVAAGSCRRQHATNLQI